MAELPPDLDAEISFLVVDDEPVGPLSMRKIVDAIRSGEVDTHILVWWADADEWMFFDEEPQLVELLDEAAPVEGNPSEPATERGALDFNEQFAVLARARDAHQSAMRSPDDASQPNSEATEESESVTATELASEGEDAQAAEPESPALSGLFGASARAENGLVGPSAPALPQDAQSSGESLEAVGARIEALTAATRHSTLAAALSGPAKFIEGLATDSSDPQAQSADLDSAIDAGHLPDTPGEPADAVNSEAAVGAEAHVPDEEKHVANFEALVKKSEANQRRLEWATRVDELLLAACIETITGRGFTAMDISSTGQNHRVGFESEEDNRFVVLQIVPLVNIGGDAFGRHMEVEISWGQDVNDLAQAAETVHALSADGETKPGKVRAAIDPTGNRVFTKVDLLWAGEDFVSPDFEVDADAVDDAVAAALHILERRWYKLFMRRR